jgi:hypothetical protein
MQNSLSASERPDHRPVQLDIHPERLGQEDAQLIVLIMTAWFWYPLAAAVLYRAHRKGPAAIRSLYSMSMKQILTTRIIFAAFICASMGISAWKEDL